MTTTNPMSKPMTIGQLARQTGVPIKTLRHYERLGFIYTLGRSESNYRLFDDSALWCVQAIQRLRSLGLTLKEIREITTRYLEHPAEPVGPLIQEKLDPALARVEARITELQALRGRILHYRTTYAAVLAGLAHESELFAPDPRRTARGTIS